MTRRRWIADEFDADRDRAILIGEHAAHLARVLRAKIGQEFEIALPGEHPVRLGRIVAINDSRVEFELGQPGSAILRPTFELTLLLAICPEGGWTEEELALFAQHAWQAATLGRSILRAETAVVAALAIVASSLQFSAAK